MPASATGIRVGYLAGRYPGRIGNLYGPRDRKGPFEFLPYALDNRAFGAHLSGEEWSPQEWVAMLEWAKLSGQRPLWALVPDVVADRERTLRNWDTYAPKLEPYGWPMAFAVQDGMTPADIPAAAAVVFVGGSTEWKWKTVRMWCEAFPRVHVGRVNSYRRLWECHDAGAESCDGTGWFRGDQQSRRKLPALAQYLEESTNGGRVRQMELIGYDDLETVHF